MVGPDGGQVCVRGRKVDQDGRVRPTRPPGGRRVAVVEARLCNRHQGIGRALVIALRDRLAAEPGTPNVALSYSPDNTAARALYLDLGFVETGEWAKDEVVARWTPQSAIHGDWRPTSPATATPRLHHRPPHQRCAVRSIDVSRRS